MITLSVALYSLLCLCTAVNISDIKELQVLTVNTTVKASDIKDLQVKKVKPGEDVTMECDITMIKNKDKVVWYRQSFGKLPQLFAKPYRGNLGYTFDPGFNDSRFSITVNDHKFDLNIIKTREDDGGDYFCGQGDGSLLKFTSGTRLQFEGKKMKLCPTPGTVNKNTDSVTLQGSDCRDGKGDYYWINTLTIFNIISVIVIMALIGVLFKNQRKGASSRNHQIPTNQADDEDVLNYAAVSFTKKPSSSRTSRDKSHEDVYAQVKIK